MTAKSAFMREAIRLSITRMRRGQGGPFGAVIVRDGRIVGRGWNQVTSANDPTAHAEVVAIRDACRRLKTHELAGCEIFTSCEPCPMCHAAIYWARIRMIYYGNTRSDAARLDFDDAAIERELRAPEARRSIPMKRFLGREALVAFREWRDLENKIPY